MFSKLIGLFGKMLFWGFIALVICIVALGGYFFYKSGQPMQVAAAQRLAPGITYQEFWQDRIQRWTEIDNQKAAQGKGRACVITGHVTFFYWICGSIYNVTRVYSDPESDKAKNLSENPKGFFEIAQNPSPLPLSQWERGETL